MNPKISIIINFYNSEEFISKAIESVICQSYKDIEIILVDDGSKDNSLNIVKKYLDIDKRIKIYSQEHVGLCASRNYGIEKATGEYIMFVDSDDWLEKDSCKTLITYLNSKTNVDILFFNFKFIKEEITKINKFPNNIRTDKIYKFNNIYKDMLLFENVVWNKIYKLNFIKKNNIKFNPDFQMHEDILFAIEMFYYNPSIIFTKDVIYNYRLRNNSASRISSKEMIISLQLMYEYVIQKAYYKNKFKEFIDNLFLKSCCFLYENYKNRTDRIILCNRLIQILLNITKQNNVTPFNSYMYIKLFIIIIYNNLKPQKYIF